MASQARSSVVSPPGTRLGPRQNLATPERILSAAAGTVLGLAATRRGGFGGIALGLVATAFLTRGATGAALIKRLVGPGPDDVAAARQAGWSSAAVVARSVTINRPRQEVHDYFRNFSNLPNFMENIQSIVETDDRHSHWVVAAPGGTKVEWDAVLTDKTVPGEVIAWESLPGALVANRGTVEFRDAVGGRGTAVHATIIYRPPGGTIGKLVAKLTQKEPGIQVRRDLKRLKMLLETGEIATNAPQGIKPKS